MPGFFIPSLHVRLGTSSLYSQATQQWTHGVGVRVSGLASGGFIRHGDMAQVFAIGPQVFLGVERVRQTVGGGVEAAYTPPCPLPFAANGGFAVGFNGSWIMRWHAGLEVPTPLTLGDSRLSVGVEYMGQSDLSGGQMQHGVSLGLRINWGPPHLIPR